MFAKLALNSFLSLVSTLLLLAYDPPYTSFFVDAYVLEKRTIACLMTAPLKITLVI